MYFLGRAPSHRTQYNKKPIKLVSPDERPTQSIRNEHDDGRGRGEGVGLQGCEKGAAQHFISWHTAHAARQRGRSRRYTGHSPVREPTQADYDDVISGRVLSGDGLHAICPAAGDDCDTLSIVGLLEAGGKIVHDVLKRDAHVVEGPVRVHDRVLEESIGVDVVKEGRHPKYEDSLPAI